MHRAAARVAGVMFIGAVIGISLPVGVARARPTEQVVVKGVGAAHGFGLAMDGVEAQADAGWTHDRILSLFYPGTVAGRASGPIRVGLAEAGLVALTFPNGGVLSDAPRGGGGSVAATLQPGARVSVRRTDDGLAVNVDGKPLPPKSGSNTRPATEKTAATARQEPEDPPPLLPTSPPLVEPTPTPAPKPEPTPPTQTSRPPGDGAIRNVWVWGTGEPALVGVDATGRRYRGSISVLPRKQVLSVVNHIDIETYVAGIAEEKGAGWPLEGLKTLAVAARTLGAATRTWYTKNQANGYDICPTANCQVYLGYDGEEPLMRQATAETAGVIRTFDGRPILAMYHGNGGGQTESYKRVIDNGTDPHPYLRSVKYPFADPSTWTRQTTLSEIETSLRTSGVAVAGELRGVEVTEHGESPRVMRLKLIGADGDTDIGGVRFADALELPSTWFELSSNEAAFSVTTEALGGRSAPISGWTATRNTGGGGDSWWAAVLTASLAVGALVAAFVMSPTETSVGGLILRIRRASLRLRHAPS